MPSPLSPSHLPTRPRLQSSSSSSPPPLLPSPPPPPMDTATTSSAASARRPRCVGGRSAGGTVAWGSATTIGRRREMEDAVAVVPDFLNSPCSDVGGCAAASAASSTSNIRFFGVYDGHGGSQVATYCARRVHELVAEKWQNADGGNEWQRRWEVAFTDGFVSVDNEIIVDAVAPEMVGSTAVAVVVSGCQIIASNCGDSRAVLCRGNQIIQLTVDHKPDRSDELERIEAGGGKVISWEGARVMGVLAMSRSLGDRYMRPWIIPVPETTFTSRTEEDECLILASDGLWDVLSNELAGNVACRLLRHQRRNGVVDGEAQPPAQVVADHLTNLAYGKSSSDNISVIVVDLKSKRRQTRRNPDRAGCSNTGLTMQSIHPMTVDADG